MTAIIRVKRHRQDDPVEAVLLACKRRRTEVAGTAPSFEKVLSFSGTVEKKDDLVAQKVVESFSDRKKTLDELKTRKPDILSKTREENKMKREESRFKVISCFRSSLQAEEDGGEGDDSDEKSKNLAIFDVSIEKDDKSTTTTTANSQAADDAYVYDLYSADLGNDEFVDIYLDNVVGIQPYYPHSFDLQYRNPEDYADDIFDPDSDDSNDENNWRNDYPDTDRSYDDSDCGFDMPELTSRLTLGKDGSDLSSDEGEERYANYEADDKGSYHFYEAEDLGGRGYAEYKRRVLRELGSPGSNGSFDPDEEEEEEEEAF